MTLPDRLPILSQGKQPPGSGAVCAEQAVGWLVSGRLDLGDETDQPSCVQPVLNALAITVNDRLTDDERQAMWPLILRQPGTARPEMEPVLSVRLACWLADAVRDLRRDEDQALCDAAVAAARAWCDCPCKEHAAAAAAAYAAATAYAAAAATYTAAANAAAAAAYAAYTTAHAAHAAYAATATATVDAATYAGPVALLAGAQAECERLTGHVPAPIDAARIERLGELVGAR